MLAVLFCYRSNVIGAAPFLPPRLCLVRVSGTLDISVKLARYGLHENPGKGLVGPKLK